MGPAAVPAAVAAQRPQFFNRLLKACLQADIPRIELSKVCPQAIEPCLEPIPVPFETRRDRLETTGDRLKMTGDCFETTGRRFETIRDRPETILKRLKAKVVPLQTNVIPLQKNDDSLQTNDVCQKCVPREFQRCGTKTAEQTDCKKLRRMK